MKDEMGDTSTELLFWMLEVAEQRMENTALLAPKTKTIELKFSKNTLKMWVDRVRNLLPKPY